MPSLVNFGEWLKNSTSPKFTREAQILHFGVGVEARAEFSIKELKSFMKNGQDSQMSVSAGCLS